MNNNENINWREIVAGFWANRDCANADKARSV